MAEITIGIVNDEIKDFLNPVAGATIQFGLPPQRNDSIRDISLPVPGAFIHFGNTIQKNDDIIVRREFMPWWLGRLDLNPTEDRIGTISGTVKVLGVLQVKSRVNLYYRKSGQLIESTFTDKDGVFLFKCGLNRNVSDYYAVAMTEQPFNAQIFDKLTPA
jgi:hypothetical protein